jgi:hypothetical protein
MKKQHIQELTAEHNDDVFLSLLTEGAQSERYRQYCDHVDKTAHPTGEALYNYVLDWLEEAEARTIRAHIACCGTCAREAMRLMRLEDELLQETLESAEISYAPSDSQVESEILASPEQTRTQPATPLRQIGERLVDWISELWEPQWAGQLVTATDIPEQTHLFTSEHGDINVSCYWRTQYRDEPAHIHIAWKADLLMERRIWLRFLHPETRATCHEVCLGTRTVGEETFTSQDLGFDPSAQRWALSVILTEVGKCLK